MFPRRSSGSEKNPNPTIIPHIKLEVQNFSFKYMPLEEIRNMEVSWKSLFLSLRTDEGSSLPNAEIFLERVAATGGSGFSFFLNKCQSDTLVINDSWQCKCQLDNPSVELTEESVCWWREYGRRVVEGVAGGGEEEELWGRGEAASSEASVLAPPSLSLEVNSFSLRLTPHKQTELDFYIEYISVNAKGYKMMEVGVDTVWCRRMGEGETRGVTEGTHHWNTPLQLSAGLLRFESGNWHRRIHVQLDKGKLEWDAALMALARMWLELRPSRRPSPPALRLNIKPYKMSFKLHATNSVLLLPARNTGSFHEKFSVCTCLTVSDVYMENSVSNVLVSIEQATLFYLPKLKSNVQVSHLSKGAKFQSSVKTFAFALRKKAKEMSFHCAEGVNLTWSPQLHISLLDTYRNGKMAYDKLNIPPSVKNHDPHPQPFYHISVSFDGPTNLRFALPGDRRIEFVGPSLQAEVAGQQAAIVSPLVKVLCDGREIITAENLSMQKLFGHENMQATRHACKEFQTQENTVWVISMDSLSAIFPYGYKFCEIYEEGINVWKWIKLVHERKRKTFTVDSPLPSDMIIFIKCFVFQLDDDPFEVKLRDNYELLVDEFHESERRREMLQAKLDDLRKANPLLPRTNQEVQKSLLKKNAEIYIQRTVESKQLSPTRSQLFRWQVKRVDIRIAADKTLHGTDNVLRLMRSCNTERWVEFDFDHWLMELRDYGQPYIEMKNGHLWGKLAGAEQTGHDRSIRDCTVQLEKPWGTYKVQRNMSPLKFYYDLGCEMDETTVSYGPCWEPCLAMVNLCFNDVNSPSRDPSPPLPFWDKIRLLLHGRLSMLCARLVTTMLAAPDPYTTTEQLEITWEKFGFDWQNSVIVVHSDVNAFVRTASKYDDIRLFHLPSLEFKIKMDWVCFGDKHDHHSVHPSAPDKLPDFSLNREHDSYRAFRSKQMNLSLSLEMKNVRGEMTTDSQCPQMLIYANTFRWLDNLKNTMSAVNRPVKRGNMFKNPRQKRDQLSRHYRNIQLRVSLPKFIISYWMSFSSDHGFRLSCQSLRLSSTHQLTFNRSGDELKRRAQAQWSIRHFSVDLMQAEIVLFGERPSMDHDSTSSFFIGLKRLTYARKEEPDDSNGEIKTSDDSSVPVHRLVMYDLRGQWTKENRDAILAILDGMQKARRTDRSKSIISTGSPPPGRIEGSHAVSMLEQLISEAATKFVAYSEETTEIPTDSLYGVALCEIDDILWTGWEIELVNSQVALKGCETGGFVLCAAQRAKVTQRIHKPVWREAQLLGKRSWVALLSGMQYYAPFNFEIQPSDIRWLSSDFIENRSQTDQSSDHLIADEEAVGGIIPENTCQQLQRVISRCSCQIYFCHFSETFDVQHAPSPEFEETDFLQKKEYVDCFTLKHNMLNVSTNPMQYQVIMDILSNLLLYVDPKKKESAEMRLRLRFKLQLQSCDDMKPVILELQNEVRCLLNRSRQLERQAFHLERELRDRASAVELTKSYNDLELDIERCKSQLSLKCEELGKMISCFKEKQVRQVKQMTRFTEEDLAPIARRFEVCFEDAQWRLTEKDGQLGITDLQIRNFMYTKISRINNSGDHVLEVGSVKITNLLPNSRFRDVLQSQHQSSLGAKIQPAVRVICREMPPVGGIPVKGHFEINVIPMVAQMTYAYYRAIMNYFFPGRNIDKADQQNLDTDEHHPPKSKGSKSLGKKKGSEKNLDEIEKMKERAEKNNMFHYVKIPEVSFCVSYKGEKDKNLEDVDNFQLQFPLVEYHDRNWTWLDMALAIKQRAKRVLVQQFMKQKLLRNRLMGGVGPSHQEASSMPEEDKIKILLGDLGAPEKEKKGGVLSKKS